MDNPWLEIVYDEPPYILPEEEVIIEKLNNLYRSENKTQYIIKTELFPEPFIGDITNAKLVLLNLNPGLDKRDFSTHLETNYIQAFTNNLSQNISGDFPFYPLDPQFSHTGNAAWWTDRLKKLTGAVGVKNVAKHLVVLEFFPYHSKKYDTVLDMIPNKYGMNDYLPSQKYTFHLLNTFLEKEDVMIVGFRHHKEWLNVCEGLKDKVILGRSWLNPHVSPGNLGEENFDKIVQIFK
jgi:hypothetical protein